ncbi:Crp/Fnr family transcriptional regulator [Streptomyces sp. Caat 7-52]|uniref:Crp/Fnr family transcriptional regulator n=1 Tax=Streptomyces sp. Caat 7-52 TaxID=2949637 RepID=UPI0020360542|nr:Crp/Fnr family transcriptional regulator [Streptomyces sp. Caat 7-52]
MASPTPRIDAFNPSSVLAGKRRMPEGTFLGYLPAKSWSRSIRPRLTSRIFNQGDMLPLGPTDGAVHVVLGGCLLQERFPFGTGKGAPVVVRFRGTGEFLGEAKLIEPTAHVRTVCLSTTWVMTCSIRRMKVLLNRHPEAELALLRSLEARNRSDEKIYCTADRPPLDRVSTLLLHLAQTAGTRDPDDPAQILIDGPRQSDLARSLLLGQSTVENAVAELRHKHRVIASRYRQLVVTDIARLKRIVTPALPGTE